jgi:hypothetical protein
MALGSNRRVVNWEQWLAFNRDVVGPHRVELGLPPLAESDMRAMHVAHCLGQAEWEQCLRDYRQGVS